MAFRESVQTLPNFSTFYATGLNHTMLVTDAMFTARAGGVRLVEWMAKILNGESPGHAGP